jgi:hypothetical protein
MRKRKVTYPVARTATRQPRSTGLAGDPSYVRSTVATINLAALDVRDDLVVGGRVRIGGSGLYAGELAVVETILGGIIPAAMVRTDAGKTRRVRAVDLERVTAERIPAESSPTTGSPAESSPTTGSPADRAPAGRNPAESNPVESSAAGRNPAESASARD